MRLTILSNRVGNHFFWSRVRFLFAAALLREGGARGGLGSEHVSASTSSLRLQRARPPRARRWWEGRGGEGRAKKSGWSKSISHTSAAVYGWYMGGMDPDVARAVRQTFFFVKLPNKSSRPTAPGREPPDTPRLPSPPSQPSFSS